MPGGCGSCQPCRPSKKTASKHTKKPTTKKSTTKSAPPRKYKSGCGTTAAKKGPARKPVARARRSRGGCCDYSSSDYSSDCSDCCDSCSSSCSCSECYDSDSYSSDDRCYSRSSKSGGCCRR